MVLLNFGFTNINVSKGSSAKGKVNVQSNMNITDVSVSKAIQKGEQTPFSIQFTYKTEYTPSKGYITLEGELLYLAGKDIAENIQTEWEKNKALPQKIAVSVYNKILHNCSVEALLLSREVGLPAPLQLPKLKQKAPTKKSTTKKSATKNTPKKK